MADTRQGDRFSIMGREMRAKKPRLVTDLHSILTDLTARQEVVMLE